jgi:UDP-N-acetylmuramate--alanine ligase
VLDYTAFIVPDLTLRVPGGHMIRNAAVALAVAEHLGVDKRIARRALEQFSGVVRRFDHQGTTEKGADVYDDYAHHPSEIRATLRAARERFPGKRIHVIFQPHLFSRTKLLFVDFAASFGDADEVIFEPIYAAREAPDPEISSELLADEARKRHPHASFARTDEDCCRRLMGAGASDVIFTMGAGDIDRLARRLVGRGARGAAASGFPSGRGPVSFRRR